METLSNTTIENITEFLNSLRTDVSITDYVDIENIDFDDAYSSIYDMIQDNNGFDIEIIYYSNAIEYLTENDPSLRESLSIAEEMGFSPSSLNSEVLASLLASQNAQSEFSELEDEINDFFTDLKEELENEENEN